MTLSGMHAGILFVNGNEVATLNQDRLLLIPGSENGRFASSQSTDEVIAKQKIVGGLVIAAYPNESQNWRSTSVDGVEVYNLFTNARQSQAAVIFFDGLWSYRSYPDLMFANFFSRPSENLQQWDEAISATGRKSSSILTKEVSAPFGLTS